MIDSTPRPRPLLGLAAMVALSACHADAPAAAPQRPTPAATTASAPRPDTACIAPTSPGGVARSSVYDATYEASQAFDAKPATMWISAPFRGPAWIAIRPEDATRTVTGYTLHYTNGRITSRAPHDWTVLGLRDGQWVVVDDRVGQVGWRGNEARHFELRAPGSYEAYCVHITNDNDKRDGVVVISLGEIALHDR